MLTFALARLFVIFPSNKRHLCAV